MWVWVWGKFDMRKKRDIDMGERKREIERRKKKGDMHGWEREIEMRKKRNRHGWERKLMKKIAPISKISHYSIIHLYCSNKIWCEIKITYCDNISQYKIRVSYYNNTFQCNIIIITTISYWCNKFKLLLQKKKPLEMQ